MLGVVICVRLFACVVCRVGYFVDSVVVLHYTLRICCCY